MQHFQKLRVVPGPAFDLAAFQVKVRAGNFHPYTTSALRRVIAVYECSRAEARRIIQTIVCKLAKHDYVRTVRLNNGMLADEYGTRFDELGWYVKLLINQDDGEHDVVSCHLTRYPLTTMSETIDAFDPGME